MPGLVRGAIAMTVMVAGLALSGCGGGTDGTVGDSSTIEAPTTASPTISVPARVLVMDAGGQRLATPDEFTFNVQGAVVGKHLHWANWGEPAATAVGAFSERRFSSSNRVRFRSTLRLTRLRVCEDAEYYTHASLPVPSSPTQPSVRSLPTPCG